MKSNSIILLVFLCLSLTTSVFARDYLVLDDGLSVGPNLTQNHFDALPKAWSSTGVDITQMQSLYAARNGVFSKIAGNGVLSASGSLKAWPLFEGVASRFASQISLGVLADPERSWVTKWRTTVKDMESLVIVSEFGVSHSSWNRLSKRWFQIQNTEQSKSRSESLGVYLQLGNFRHCQVQADDWWNTNLNYAKSMQSLISGLFMYASQLGYKNLEINWLPHWPLYQLLAKRPFLNQKTGADSSKKQWLFSDIMSTDFFSKQAGENVPETSSLQSRTRWFAQLLCSNLISANGDELQKKASLISNSVRELKAIRRELFKEINIQLQGDRFDRVSIIDMSLLSSNVMDEDDVDSSLMFPSEQFHTRISNLVLGIE